MTHQFTLVHPRCLPTVLFAALMAGCSPTPAPQSVAAPVQTHVLSEQSTAAALPTLCKEGSAPVFEGEVEDDFGLAVAACLAPESDATPARVSVHYSGEGGSREVSCIAGECSGVIDMTRYTRYRFTVLTLTWRDENGVQTLTETLDAEDTSAPAKRIVTHSWQPREWSEEHGEVPSFPVSPVTEPLEMLSLEPHLHSEKPRS